MMPEISRERGAIQFMVGEACPGEAPGVAATPGRSEPCFACLSSRFVFLRRPIFLPNKISCKDNKPAARLFGQSVRLSEASAMQRALIRARRDAA
jgi:hypothetical protein